MLWANCFRIQNDDDQKGALPVGFATGVDGKYNAIIIFITSGGEGEIAAPAGVISASLPAWTANTTPS
jgi:hypothetical protein